MASFAAGSDMLTYYDARRLSALLSDSGTRVSDVENNPILLAMLARATEEVLAHATRGKKYTETELQALADSETSGYYLVGLCCDLAYGYLVQRRGFPVTEIDRQAPSFNLSLLKLQQLADGTELFPRIEEQLQQDAGTPNTADLTNRTTTPCSYTNTAYLRLLPSRPFGNYRGGCNGNC